MLLKICPNILSFNKSKHHAKFERDRQEMKMYPDDNNLMTGEHTDRSETCVKYTKAINDTNSVSKGDNEVDMRNT